MIRIYDSVGLGRKNVRRSYVLLSKMTHGILEPIIKVNSRGGNESEILMVKQQLGTFLTLEERSRCLKYSCIVQVLENIYTR